MNKDTIFQVIISILVVALIGMSGVLYIFCERQKTQMQNLAQQNQAQNLDNSNQFKYQEAKIEGLTKDLQQALQELKQEQDNLTEQKNSLLNEIEKRQRMENDSKAIQTSLIDITAEADAIKQDMKGWQKDYVSVLAQLEKKLNDSQGQLKSFEDHLTALNIPELKENIDSLKAEIETMSQAATPGGTPAADSSQTISNSATDASVTPSNP